METIFDHNVTDEELNIILASHSDKTKQGYVKNLTDRLAYEAIVMLYGLRKDEKTAEKYRAKRDATLRVYDDWQ